MNLEPLVSPTAFDLSTQESRWVVLHSDVELFLQGLLRDIEPPRGTTCNHIVDPNADDALFCGVNKDVDAVVVRGPPEGTIGREAFDEFLLCTICGLRATVDAFHYLPDDILALQVFRQYAVHSPQMSEKLV